MTMTIPKIPNSYFGTSRFVPKLLLICVPMFERPSRSR